MSSLTLNLDTEAIQAATTQALLGALTAEVKEKLVLQAIQAILKPSTDSWNRNQSPLTQAFERAISQVAGDLCLEHVRNDPVITEKLKELIAKTAHAVLNTDTDKLTEKMKDAFIRSIASDR